MAFFDLTEIMEEEERMPCIFRRAAKHVGFLDASRGEEVRQLAVVFPCNATRCAQDIEETARVELPIWLARELAERNMVTVDLPRGFGTRFRQQLIADASTVSLRERSPHFFRLCIHAAQILLIAPSSSRVSASSLPQMGLVALAARSIRLLDKAPNCVGEDVALYRASLTDFEQAIFQRSYELAKERFEWKHRRSAALKVSQLERVTRKSARSSSGEVSDAKRVRS
jgi:hypothetical protein